MMRDEYISALDHLGLTQSQAGPFFGAHEQTGRRWADADGKGPPESVAMFLRLMIQLEITPDQVRRLLAQDDAQKL